MMTFRNPCTASLCKCCSSKLFPDTFNSGFGVVSDNGRMRSPRPAAKIKTVVSSGFTVNLVIKIAYIESGIGVWGISLAVVSLSDSEISLKIVLMIGV